MQRRFWRTETGLFLGVWLVLMVAGRSQLFRDPGTFWHTVLGRQILDQRAFVWTDSFSFTFAGQPYTARNWLAECGMALLHQWAGWDGLLLVTVSVLAGLYTWAGHRLIRVGMTGGLAILLTVLAIAASAYHFHARPHLATIVLLGWTFARLCDFEAGRLTIRELFWLVPVFVVWMNTHDGAIGGLATLVLVVAGWISVAVAGRLAGRDCSWLPRGPMRDASSAQCDPANAGVGVESIRSMHTTSDTTPIVALVLLVLGCGATSLLTPYGWEVPKAWISILNSPVVSRVMDEHRPLFDSSDCWPVVLFASVYLAALAGVRPPLWRVTWLIPLVWFYLACTRIRHGPLFAITAVIALADMWPHIAWVRWLDRSGSVLFHLRSPDHATLASDAQADWPWRSFAIPLALLSAVAASLTVGVTAPVVGRGWARLDATHWPVDLLPELQRYEREHPDGTPIFNDMLFGGFLIYHTPGLRVFIDDRCELYGDERLEAYIAAMRKDSPLIEQWTRQYGFEIALVAPGSAFDSYFSHAPGWGRQFQTPAANLYRRLPSAK